MKVLINGKFLSQKITGVQRYANEIVKEIDKQVSNLKNIEYSIVVPDNVKIDNLQYKNISIFILPGKPNYYWEQIKLVKFFRKNKFDYLLSLGNVSPILLKGKNIVCIHDMGVFLHPNFYSKKFVLAYKYIFNKQTKYAKAILTVTNYSKQEIIKHYPKVCNKVIVASPAVNEDFGAQKDKSLDKFNEYISKTFYFSIGSAGLNKNIKYIYKLAEKNPNELFLISGSKNNFINSTDNQNNLSNVIHLGYLTDDELSYIYSKTKGFIFPSLYEGFGLPPLEAIKCGCKCIIVSDLPVMHEVLGEKGINYINPSDYETNILNRNLVNIGDFENKFSWEKSAKKILDLFLSFDIKDC